MAKIKEKIEIKIRCKGAGELPLSMLEPFQGKFKKLSKARHAKLRQQIIDKGFSFPIAVWECPNSNKVYILDGHQRRIVLVELKKDGYIIPQIPVVFVDADSYEEAKEKLLAAASVFGEIDTEGAIEFLSDTKITVKDIQEKLELNLDMTEFIKNFKVNDVDVKVGEVKTEIEVSGHTRTIGGNKDDIDDNSGDDNDDELPEVETRERAKLGQIYLLGEHRLMCGDSTDENNIKALIGDNKIDLIYTDPPYGINEQTDRAFASRSRIAKGNSFKKIAGDDSIDTALKVYELCEKISKTICYWGGNYYAHKLPPSPCWLVWDKRVEENQRDMNSDCELAYVKHPSKKSIRIFRHLWKGMMKGSEIGQARVHPTQKPIALAEFAINELNPEGHTVLDLFGGSGSTLIAAEKMHRRAYLMELEPDYVDIMIARWEKFTGATAVLLNDDKKTVTKLRKKNRS